MTRNDSNETTSSTAVDCQAKTVSVDNNEVDNQDLDKFIFALKDIQPIFLSGFNFDDHNKKEPRKLSIGKCVIIDNTKQDCHDQSSKRIKINISRPELTTEGNNYQNDFVDATNQKKNQQNCLINDPTKSNDERLNQKFKSLKVKLKVN